ncbi:glutamine amidotransferase-related protein [Helicobacter muridarum]|uniref:Imidazole glycerol phosphate synthase subunit HisH n=1 Tax=Helicobacter muridarum TaxID=216 RepID=A0A377PW28_9HELI|nr:imidazole glycerol phosphate synthase subunit HisH [Helicobacter muridarum]STQ85833.1 imidazole glycerol phosphate synthase subunit [Helicobacter muridarum]
MILGVLDYNICNIANALRALEYIATPKYKIKRVTTIEDIGQCDKLIIPGVGAFKSAMDNFVANGLDHAIIEFASSGKYLLGICLGMQLLFDRSYEFGIHNGLGLIEGDIVHFGNSASNNVASSLGDISNISLYNSANVFVSTNVKIDSSDMKSNEYLCQDSSVGLGKYLGEKIPHIGWNQNFITKQHRLLYGLDDGFYLYFVHSYCASCEIKYIIARCEYICSFPSVVCKDNILGVQPHPERSHKDGLKILSNFLLL